MTRLGGMKLSEFNGIVEQMKSIYPFKDDDAMIVSVQGMEIGETPCRLEVLTKDENTGVTIVMSKNVEIEPERIW